MDYKLSLDVSSVSPLMSVILDHNQDSLLAKLVSSPYRLIYSRTFDHSTTAVGWQPKA